MAYKQGYTNAKNALADFITAICFDDLAKDKFETWELIYPANDDREAAFEQILNERRATIGSTFIPKNEWKNEEVFKIDKNHLDSFDNFLTEEFPVTSRFLSDPDEYVHCELTRIPSGADNIIVKLYEIDNTVSPANLTEVNNFIYNSNKEMLDDDEFYIDENINVKDIVILKSNFSISSDDEFIIKIQYNLKNPTFDIPLLSSLYDREAIKLRVKGSNGVFYNNESLDKLNIMEFYADTRYKKITLLKDTVNISDDEEIIFLVTYQTYASSPMTWYVEFNYPETTMSGKINYNYFEWKFSNAIDSNFRVTNNKKEPPIMRCFWHTINKLKIESAEWLPIEYFISWDDSAISFVFCEDPITDLNSVMHAFNYIGVLDSIKNADYDDIASNFGSCGSYDITVAPGAGLATEVSGNMPRANITFRQKIFDGYYAKIHEQTLLKVNNVPYGNFSVPQDMIDDANLVQPMVQQIIVGDTAQSVAAAATPSPVKTTSPIGTTTSLYSTLQGPTIVEYTIPDAVKIMKVPDTTNTELTTSKAIRTTLANGVSIRIPKDGSKITLMKNANVVNTVTNATVMLPMGTEIVLLADLTATSNTNGIINLASNTVFRTDAGEQYKTTAITQILSNKVILLANVQFTTKEDTETYAPNPNGGTQVNTYPAGTVFKIITSSIDVGFDMLQEYFIEFHYKEPFLGDMHYDFPSKWFNGSVSKTFTDFSGSTVLPTGTVAPILAERMVPNSDFENEYIVPDVYTSTARNKSNLLGRLSYTQSGNNNYHKNKIIVPEIITNTQTGESWVRDSVQTRDTQIEKTIDSITNICLYPGQVYVGNFCYNKRTMNKCTVTLGVNDVSRMRLVLTNSANETLVDFNGTQTYQNLTIVRNVDNGVTIEVDFDNLVNETVYLKMYKINNYFKNSTGGYWDDKYYNAYDMLINTTFEYLGLVEQITRIKNTLSFKWASWGSTYPDPSYDYFTSIPIITNSNPVNGTTLNNLFRLLTIDLNSIHKTFIPNVVGMTNMQNTWM